MFYEVHLLHFLLCPYFPASGLWLKFMMSFMRIVTLHSASVNIAVMYLFYQLNTPYIQLKFMVCHIFCHQFTQLHFMTKSRLHFREWRTCFLSLGPEETPDFSSESQAHKITLNPCVLP